MNAGAVPLRNSCLAVALLWLAIIALPAIAEPVTHRATGIVFPDEIAGFQREGVSDHESRSPGLGFSYHYKLPTRVLASIYIYTAGLASVPTAIDHPVMTQLREQTVREIAHFAQSRGDAARHSLNATIKVKTDGGEVPVLFDGFIISSPGGARNTFAFLWSARGHFMKIRMTREPGGVLEPSQMMGFVETVARLAAPQKDAKRRVEITLARPASPVEMAAWTAYGLGLANWVTKNGAADSAAEGIFVPSFDAELQARQSQLQIWREMNEKSPQPLPYMDAMLQVAAAGFLREYLWQHHRQPGWGAPPADLKLDDFSRWSGENLRDHVPQTGAHVVFGPPVAK